MGVKKWPEEGGTDLYFRGAEEGEHGGVVVGRSVDFPEGIWIQGSATLDTTMARKLAAALLAGCDALEGTTKMANGDECPNPGCEDGWDRLSELSCNEPKCPARSL